MIRVGVVVPTFERPEETLRAVESVLAQTLPVAQIIVVDDGSNGESLTRLKSKLEGLPIELIELSHSGHPGIVRNAGLNKIATEWVAFLDSDDLWKPEKIEVQINQINKLNAVAVCSNATIMGNQGRFFPKFPKRISFRKLLRRNLIITSSVLVKTSVLREVDGFATSTFSRGSEDYATWLRIGTLCDWQTSDTPLVIYNDDSISSIRKSEEFTQANSNIYGILDFISWRDSKGRSPSILLKSVLRVLTWVA
ncbi:putative glycosyl transferase [Candidatus Nanopelagicaceae bacterium]